MFWLILPAPMFGNPKMSQGLGVAAWCFGFRVEGLCWFCVYGG